MMISDNNFNEVHDCQEAFRQILYAISNPGKIVSIREQAIKLGDSYSNSIFLTFALTLLDKETSFWVVDNEVLAQTISDLTYSNKHENKSAGIIFVTKECSLSKMKTIIRLADPGTLIEPHTNSILIIGIDKFVENPTCKLKGPGIKDSITANLPEYAEDWIRQRDLLEYEFPTGIDIYFIDTTGAVLAVPRKVKMEG